MSNLVQAIAEVRKLAVKAETPVEQFMRTAEVIAERQTELDATNRASQEERQAIDAYLEALNGNISSDLPAGDIAVAAGVRLNRGTSQYASRGKKRLLLTYRKG